MFITVGAKFTKMENPGPILKELVIYWKKQMPKTHKQFIPMQHEKWFDSNYLQPKGVSLSYLKGKIKAFTCPSEISGSLKQSRLSSGKCLMKASFLKKVLRAILPKSMANLIIQKRKWLPNLHICLFNRPLMLMCACGLVRLEILSSSNQI